MDIQRMLADLTRGGVPYVSLGEVADLQRGTAITKKSVISGDIPVIAGGREPAYTIDRPNRTGETVVIAGSGAYAGFVSYWDEPIFVSDAFSIKPHSGLMPRFLFHVLSAKQDELHAMKSGGGVPHVYAKDVARVMIPVPSLAVQCEVVRVLDLFTKLEAELEAELEARRKQYAHYRDQLLRFNAPPQELGDILVYRQPTRYLVKSKNYDPSFATPVLTAGQTFILGYTNETSGIYDASPANPVVIFDDFTTSCQWVDFPFKAKSSAMKILTSRDGNPATLRYAFHVMRSLLYKPEEHSRQWISTYSRIEVPWPDVDDRARAVRDIDAFDSLTSSLSSGLPAEIAARRRQYEFYRDQLLSFGRAA